MSYLRNTLNLIEDPDLLDDIEIFELRTVDENDMDQITPADSHSILVLVGLDGTAIPLHCFEDDMDPLAEIIDALLAEKVDVIWHDADDEIAIESLEQFVEWLEDNADTGLRQDALDALAEAL